MERARLKELLTEEMNGTRAKGDILVYYAWMQKMKAVSPNYQFYYIGGEEVPNGEVYPVLDEMVADAERR